MKKILLMALVVAIVSLSLNAYAQVPFVVVSFDESPGKWSTDCPPAGGADIFTVWAFNFNCSIAAIEYMIELCPAVTFLGDILPPEVLYIGLSQAGIAISFPVPSPVFAPPRRIQGISVFWNCAGCDASPSYWDCPVIVRPHPASGKVQARCWLDTIYRDAVGMTSIICPVVFPTKDTTWGQLRALYH